LRSATGDTVASRLALTGKPTFPSLMRKHARWSVDCPKRGTWLCSGLSARLRMEASRKRNTAACVSLSFHPQCQRAKSRLASIPLYKGATRCVKTASAVSPTASAERYMMCCRSFVNTRDDIFFKTAITGEKIMPDCQRAPSCHRLSNTSCGQQNPLLISHSPLARKNPE
jgi:hypothetical protein